VTIRVLALPFAGKRDCLPALGGRIEATRHLGPSNEQCDDGVRWRVKQNPILRNVRIAC
jgi:hypothetical protein